MTHRIIILASGTGTLAEAIFDARYLDVVIA